MEIKNIQLTMTESQANTIMKALDFYSRVGMGQLKEIKNVIEYFNKDWDKADIVDDHIIAIKEVYFPELSRDGYYGIFGSDTPEESKISWDLIQVIRYAIAWHKYPNGGYTVDFGPPIKSSLKESLADVKINVD
jgi:hypothetical protein